MDVQTLKRSVNDSMGRYRSFSEIFWNFIRNSVGITYIYQEKQSYLKKQVSFQERLDKVNVLLSRADFEDDKLNPSDQELVKWSEEALELSQIIKKLGLNKDICSEEFLLKFFKSFFAQKNNIQSLDPQMVKFENLQVLNLSRNSIRKIENLPPNLQELNLTGNQIDQIEPLRQPLTSLIHLGIAYNQVRTPALVGIARNFPNLFSLDLAFNQLCDFKSAISWLEKLSSIKMLSLAGNPLQLTSKYREIIKQRLQDLRILDGTQAFNEMEENAKKKYRKKVTARLAHLGDIPPEAYKIPEEDLIPIEENVKLELGFRLLDNIHGIYINEENCRQLDQLNLDDVPVERKSSQFWITFKDHKGNENTSEKRAWIEHFQVDPERGTGKCDLKFDIKIEEPPSIELRDWLCDDLFVNLLTSQPKIVMVPQDDGEAVKDIKLAEDGLPEIEEKTLGVMRLNLSRLIYTADPSDKDLDYHKINMFYEASLCDRPEFMFKNQLINLKDTEIEMLEADLAGDEDEHRRRVALESQEGVTSQNAKSKQDPKKDKGKAAKGAADDKNAPKSIEVEYPEVESEPNFILLEKTFTQLNKKPEAKKPVAKSVMSQATVASGAAAAGGDGQNQTLEQKRQARLKELKEIYNTVRSLPFSLAVVTKLNVQPPPVKIEEPPVDPDVTSKMSKEQPKKGGKKK